MVNCKREVRACAHRESLHSDGLEHVARRLFLVAGLFSATGGGAWKYSGDDRKVNDFSLLGRQLLLKSVAVNFSWHASNGAFNADDFAMSPMKLNVKMSG